MSNENAVYSTLRSANKARQLQWDGSGAITATYQATELAGEVGEACNVIKKLERERLGLVGSRDTVEHLAEELADSVIVLDLIAQRYGIDLFGDAVPRKFNATSRKNGFTVLLCKTNGEVP